MQPIVEDLTDAGYLRVDKVGRRNRYVPSQGNLHPIEEHVRIGELLEMVLVERKRAELNIELHRDLSARPRAPRNVRGLIDHYTSTELPARDRVSYSTASIHRSILGRWIAPQWADYSLAEVVVSAAFSWRVL